jgi:signal transduction histidine kinase
MWQSQDKKETVFTAPNQGARPKLLLVDDREDNLLLIETVLEGEGYEFIRARSGRDALKILLNEFDFALILMDVKMPNLSGFDTAALIYEREKLRHIPIIFVTAHSYNDENVFRGYKAGAVDYIYKPVNPVLLKAKVAVFVQLYKKNRQLVVQEQKLIAINQNLEEEIREQKKSQQKIKDLNRQLLETVDRLESANKELDRFAFMASHDLQEPLRKIRIFSDRIAEKYHEMFDNDGKLFIDRIQVAATRMQALITDILTISKISIMNDPYENSDLSALLAEVVKDNELFIQEKNATIEVAQLPNLLVIPGLIRPLFHNILGNALKYSRKDVPPYIKVYSELSNAEGNPYCRIYFEDNGIGFDQRYADQIFGMFKRLHSNSEFEGTGIGLALCKRIVEEHKGFITARGRVNKGAVFTISLPVV